MNIIVNKGLIIMLKKLGLAAVLAFSLTASCFAAKVEEPVTSSKIFQDNDYKISVQLPEGFDYADDNGENVVVAAEDKKGAYYRVTAVDADPSQAGASTDRKLLRKLKDGIRDEFTKYGFEIYNEYTIKINPDRFGYFMEGYTNGNSEKSRVKNSVIVFFHNDKKFYVTLRAPYSQKGYLKNFKRFRTSITCKE